MGELTRWFEELTYNDAKVILQEKLENMKRDFIAAGYYLKYIRDHEQYLEDGYGSIWEFAEDNYGIKMSTASRWMAMNDKFSQGGNSPILSEEYKEFGKSQLQEMLYLEDSQMDGITPDMTVKEIREVRKPELMSYYGTARRVYPEGSLVSESGCDGGHYCFSCHMQCEIRQKDCYCVSAPLGNPFPCTTMNMMEKLKQRVGERCQFVNLDLAEDRNGEKVPCCKECKVPCEYKCKHSIAERVEGNPEKPVATSQQDMAEDVTEIDHFTADNMIPYGAMRSEAVCKYLMTGYKNPDKECDITVLGFTYKVLKRTGVTVFYDSSGKTLFDIENERLEQEYQVVKSNEKQSVFEPSECIRDQNKICEIENDQDCPSECCFYCENRGLCDYECEASVTARTKEPAVMQEEEPVIDAEYQEVIEVEDDVLPDQPELPVLKNNDQRKEFIDSYETWPIWIDTRETGERYYKYDLTDGDSFVIKVYYHRCFDYTIDAASIEERYRDGWGGEEYYLLEEGKHFRDCLANRSWLVEKLKEIQKPV